EVRLEERPREEREQRARDREHEPALVVPAPHAAARDPALAAQARLALEDVVDVRALRFLERAPDGAARVAGAGGLGHRAPPGLAVAVAAAARAAISSR